ESFVFGEQTLHRGRLEVARRLRDEARCRQIVTRPVRKSMRVRRAFSPLVVELPHTVALAADLRGEPRRQPSRQRDRCIRTAARVKEVTPHRTRVRTDMALARSVTGFAADTELGRSGSDRLVLNGPSTKWRVEFGFPVRGVTGDTGAVPVARFRK